MLTVSFHKFGKYFPGTGDHSDIGFREGSGYSLNFPLRDGIDDANFENIFKAVIEKVMERYNPLAVVLQCGADSLSGDRLGCFNLSLKGHGSCVKYVQSFGKPLLVLGGGGYTVRNVSRCWTYETGILLGEDLADELPHNPYYEYYGPDFNLHITPSNMENLNSQRYLEKIKTKLFGVLQTITPPSVAYSTEIPRDVEVEEPEGDPNVRISQADEDKHIVDVREFYEDDKDNDKEASDRIMDERQDDDSL